MAPEERLQKFMARCGVASRRRSEEIIAAGRVKVDGEVVTEMGVKIDPERAVVEVDGRLLSPETKVYYLVNKPAGYICSNDPVGDQPPVIDLIETEDRRLYPVGRLDVDSHGLVIVTNDGDLAHRLTHPSYEVERTYRATVRGRLKRDELDKLERGLELEDGPTLPARIEKVKGGAERSLCELTLREGRNRQVRRMFAAIGHPVADLQRIRMGPLKLGRLPVGGCRPLSEAEVERLRRAGGREQPPPRRRKPGKKQQARRRHR